MNLSKRAIFLNVVESIVQLAQNLVNYESVHSLNFSIWFYNEVIGHLVFN